MATDSISRSVIKLRRQSIDLPSLCCVSRQWASPAFGGACGAIDCLLASAILSAKKSYGSSRSLSFTVDLTSAIDESDPLNRSSAPHLNFADFLSTQWGVP